MGLDPPAEPLAVLDGTEMIRVRVGNRWRWTTTAAVAALASTPQAVRDAAQDAAIAGETRTRAAADTSAADRLGVLEAKPQEVVPFSGSLTTGVLAIGTKAYTITGFPGLLAGERVEVEPVGALPTGVSIGGARVPADGTIEVTLAAVLALTVSKTIALTITALR